MIKEGEIGSGFSYSGQYRSPRRDLLRLIPDSAESVLDVGCGPGYLGEDIKRRSPGCIIVGVENDRTYLEESRRRLDEVIEADVESSDFRLWLAGRTFDCVILGDILEHLRDPWQVLRTVADALRPGGVVVASIPNVRHYSTIFALVFGGRWPYRDRGIHDVNHLRFFALKDIHDLFSQAGLEIERIERNCRIIERNHGLNRFAKYLALPLLRDFITFQYLVVGRFREGQRKHGRNA